MKLFYVQLCKHATFSNVTDFIRIYLCFIEPLNIEKDKTSESSFKNATHIHNLFKQFFSEKLIIRKF